MFISFIIQHSAIHSLHLWNLLKKMTFIIRMTQVQRSYNTMQTSTEKLKQKLIAETTVVSRASLRLVVTVVPRPAFVFVSLTEVAFV